MAVNGVFPTFIFLSFLWKGAQAYCGYCVYNYWYFWTGLVFSIVFLCVILLSWCCSYKNRKRQRVATISVNGNCRLGQQARPSMAGAGPAYPSGPVQPPQQMPVKPPDYYNGPPPAYPATTNNAWNGPPPAYPEQAYPIPGGQFMQANPAYMQPMPQPMTATPDYPQQQFPAVTDPAYPPSSARY
ncbi:uncharacterized protein LOC135500736 [Lineus longissimus]|uniref:uncharacterized protein LOC135500736 n=1 Tax=Lineus longissimus TaxID=88925 RepID=UPI002B4C44C6